MTAPTELILAEPAPVPEAPATYRAPARLQPYADDIGIHIPTHIDGLHLIFTEDQKRLTDDQMVLLSTIGIEQEWDPRQVAAYLMTCLSSELDPWRRETYLMRYKDGSPKRENGRPIEPQRFKYIHHIGIDGFRKRAEDSGEYAGQIGPQWCGEDGNWIDFWPHRDRVPVAARVGILRRGFDAPVWGIAMYDEYAPMKDEWAWNEQERRKTPNGKRIIGSPQWETAAKGGKPAVMLAKCAEAVGHRRAFPRHAGGFFAAEEFARQREHELAEDLQAAEDRASAARRAAYESATVQADTNRANRTPSAPQQPQPSAEPDSGAGAEITAEQRAWLLAELDGLAKLGGKTRQELVARWCEQHNVTLENASSEMLLTLLVGWRPMVAPRVAAAFGEELGSAYASAKGPMQYPFGRPD